MKYFLISCSFLAVLTGRPVIIICLNLHGKDLDHWLNICVSFMLNFIVGISDQIIPFRSTLWWLSNYNDRVKLCCLGRQFVSRIIKWMFFVFSFSVKFIQLYGFILDQETDIWKLLLVFITLTFPPCIKAEEASTTCYLDL